jgi:glucose/arabinose dehydrogenase
VSRPPRLVSVLTVLVLAMALAVSSQPSFAAPPTDFQKSLIVGDGLDGPSGFEIAPDGRIFVLERSGKIKVVKNGVLLPTPFADLPSEDTGDRGLIGIAFDPDFGTANHFVYFYYTGHDLLNHLVRFDASGDVGQNGPFQLFQTTSPSNLLHVGGSIRFGPDGKLYFAVGDNGTPANAQMLDNPHGKILRINKDGSIPPDNPFVGQPGKLAAIWAYGLRNPWRFQFDSATGELFGGDVGDFGWEELNHLQRGRNYGWPLKEGVCQADCAGFTDPIHAYPHAGQSAAITGGPIYRDDLFPADYNGSLFFGDYAQGWIKRAKLDGNGNATSVEDFDLQAGSVVDMKIAPDGSMYYITYYPGALYRVGFNTTSHEPVASASSDVTKGTEPLTVQFSSAGSNDPDDDPLTYLWAFGDGSTSTEPNPSHTYTAKGVYTARLTVSDGTAQTQAQPIVIQAGIPPTLIVSQPTEGQLYNAGDTITYNAFASDAAGFDLNDADIKTTVRLKHGTHFHPYAGPFTGRVGSFTIASTGESAADTAYEITTTASDESGVSTSKVVTIRPRTTQLTVTTDPPGVGARLDGIPQVSPTTVDGVVGFQRELSAPVTAVATDGTPLQFAGWSDGRAVRHTITTPATPTSFTARYVPSAPFTASYYANKDLSGSPVVTRQDPKIDFVWGEGSPDPALPNDNFSARWTKTQWFGAGRYQFRAITDDGMRLYVDGRRVIDDWFNANVERLYEADLGEGNHTITLEYHEAGGGALASLSWDAAQTQSDETYQASYWNLAPGADPAIPGAGTTPDLSRQELAVQHNWGDGGPGAPIGPDRFVAQWKRTASLAPGEYDFSVTADDGVRLIVDGVRVIDKWLYQGATTYTARIPMDGGPHTIVMEYFEHSGGAVATLSYAQVGDLPQPQDWDASYWNSPTPGFVPVVPATAPAVVRTDRAIDFDWFEGSPAAQLNADNFIARWTRTDVLSAGVYRFQGHADDGIRVYVDNVPVVDLWQPQNTDYSVDKVIASGQHTLRVEYFELGGGAVAKFDYERIGDVVPADPGFTGEYFGNRDLAGAPVLTRQDEKIDFDWGQGSPASGVPVNNFSARWTKSQSFAAGTYRFTTTTDDGVRVFVDGVQVINKWVNQGVTTHTGTRTLTEGTHQIVVEYFDSGGGALARFGYEQTEDVPPPAGVPFTGAYFANTTLTGEPAVTRSDDAVDFDWGDGTPHPSLPENGFSARWTRTKDYEAGAYRLSVTGDDGIRVLVDGTQVIDGYRDQAPTTYTAEVALTAGPHTVVIEYYERNGGAVARYSETEL